MDTGTGTRLDTGMNADTETGVSAGTEKKQAARACGGGGASEGRKGTQSRYRTNAWFAVANFLPVSPRPKGGQWEVLCECVWLCGLEDEWREKYSP